ncbi:MAG: hypothetical protein Q4G48_09535 [Bacteroidia bacterium]|nr:hypothetical protein [Bacteroidia bacterium]
MKYKLFLLFLVLSMGLRAQQQGKEISHYIFPEFKSGTVLMKNGAENPAMLNFNAATEEMVFDRNGQVLALADVVLNQLDTVFIENRKFVLLNNRFAEVINENGYKLFIQHKCRVIPPGKPAAYGGTSQTSSTTSYSSWMGDGRVYQLELPDDYKVNPYPVYWLDNGSGWKNFTSIGQIRRFYNSRRALYKQYSKENNVDFKDLDSIAGLFHFMETNAQK